MDTLPHSDWEGLVARIECPFVVTWSEVRNGWWTT